MNNPGYWKREDGEPWESVESLPRPLSVVSAQSVGHYLWQSLESLPTAFDAEPKTSSVLAKEDTLPKTQEIWSFQNLKENDDEEEKQENEDEWIATSLLKTKPRVNSRSVVEDGVESVKNIAYTSFDRFPALSEPATAHRSPSVSAPPPPWPYSESLYTAPLKGAQWQDPVRGHNGRPPVIFLSTLLEQLRNSAPVGDPRQGRRESQQLVSLLSQAPTKPNRSDFNVTDVGYVVREGALYSEAGEVVFPKVPTYLPPIARKARSPIQERWEFEERHTRTNSRRRLCSSNRLPPASTIDPFWEEQARLWPRDKHRNLRINYLNSSSRILRADDTKGLMKEWEDPALAKMSKKGKRERKKEKRERKKEKMRVDSFPHNAGNGDRKVKKLDVANEDVVEEEYVHIDKEPYYDARDPPQWGEEVELHQRQRNRERLRRDSYDGRDIDNHNSTHYSPVSPRAFNRKRIRDKVFWVLGDPSKKDESKGKASARAEEDTESIYEASDAEASCRLEKVDPYASFKRTTGRHPRHFHKSRKNPDEVFDRFVLEGFSLAEVEEELTVKNTRRPMIDVVNLKTGDRTRRKIRGYEKLPRTLRIAAGIEMIFGGLPPRKMRAAEKHGARESVWEENAEKAMRRSSERKRKKRKDGCLVM